ncbi:MAG: putative sulfate exporter family transporter [Acidobacteriia bacterium]|nr:putative sulfate exporter family transporter [Terriglobia bacterium]
MNSRTLFFVGLILCATGVVSPPMALLLGLVYGFSFPHPYHVDSRNLSRFLLQASVVGLGFGMNLQDVMHAGRSGLAYTAGGIAFALGFGLLAGRLLSVNQKTSFLITAGTAICGGSAIAAVAPIVEADQEETAVSLGTVFILNSIALLIFPAIGWAFHLSQQQFGLWSALAIHDTSSVVGATSRFGAIALVVGTTVKLTRALWIVPVSIGAALLTRSKSRIQWPWFILFFCLAAVLNTYLPSLASVSSILSNLGKLGLTATLFLIGTGLSTTTLRHVGVRPLLQGVILWIVVAISSLCLIVAGVISL